MSIEMMRKYIADAYPGETWKKKVKNMSDQQVLAVYTRLVNSSSRKEV